MGVIAVQGLSVCAGDHTELWTAAAARGNGGAARIEQLCEVKCSIFCSAKEFGYLCFLTCSLFHELLGYGRKTRLVEHVYLCSSYPLAFS